MTVLDYLTATTLVLTVLTLLVFSTLLKITYRLFFHPLRHFPGPKLAACTFLYEAYYDVFLPPGGQFVFHLDTLHNKYGPIIRCSPEEIHIRDSEWFDTLFTGPGHVRDKWERSNRANGSPGSVASAWKYDLHRRRRGALLPFFSMRKARELEESVRSKTQKLCQKLRASGDGTVIDVGTAFTAVTLDVITEYCYDRCLNTLDEEGFAPRWKQLMMGLFEQSPIGKQFPLVMQGLQKLPRPMVKIMNPEIAPFFEAQDAIAAQAKEVYLEEEKKGNIRQRTKDEDEKPKTIFHGILQSNLPDEEKTLERLQDEAFVLIVAGAETTARVTTVILAHLLQNPELLKRLQKELDTVMPSSSVGELPTSNVLEKIALMKAVVQEGLRISAPVSNRPMLIAPNEDLAYGKWKIPRGTPTSLTLRNILFDPEIFPSPNTFSPDRWLQGNAHYLERFLVTFSKGSRGCLGQNIAYVEIYLTIAAMISRFDMELIDFDQRRDLDIFRDCFVGMPSRESRGVKVRTRLRAK